MLWIKLPRYLLGYSAEKQMTGDYVLFWNWFLSGVKKLQATPQNFTLIPVKSFFSKFATNTPVLLCEFPPPPSAPLPLGTQDQSFHWLQTLQIRLDLRESGALSDPK